MWKLSAGYYRKSKSGNRHWVNGHWYNSESGSPLKPGESCITTCKDCGEKVVVIRPKRGGWLVNTYLQSGGAVLHPCFERKNAKSSSRDSKTNDLFDGPRNDDPEEDDKR
ncbi:MAG: hypothetical protein CME95_00440 [Hyphomonadaceae bacterium]|nr:hypothetical protein [Hyphomonadaceae bacterium]